MAAVTKLTKSWNVGASFNGGSSNYTFRIEVIQENQDTANNTSTVTVKKYVKGNSGNSWYGTACTDAFSGDINDSISYNPARQGSDPNYYGPMRNTEVLYHTKESYVVQHNSDGSRTLSISTTFTNGGNSYAPKTNSKSFEVPLDTIPRASTLTLNKSSVNVNTSSGNAISYTITPASSSFTHTLIWSLGGSNTTISNAMSGSLTYTQLLNKLTTSLTGQLSFTLQTYSGSTLIGTTSATASVTIDKTVFKPSITLGNIAVNSSPISGYLVAGYSSAKFTSTATKPTGASSVTTTFSATNGTLTTTSTTSTSAVTVTTNTLPGSSTNYTLSVNATAKDSRGVTASGSKTATVYAYVKPTVSLTAYRVASSTSTTRDDSGLYVYVTFSGTLGASVNNQNSIQSTTCTYTGSISGTATNGAHYSLADNQSVTFTATVADKVTSSTLSVTVSAAVYPLDLVDDGKGHVGVGLGGIAEAGFNTNYLLQKGYSAQFYQCTIGTGTSTTTYIKLCHISIKSHMQGRFIAFRIFVGQGNNGNSNQNAYIDLLLQSGWTGSLDGRLGGYWILEPMGTSFTESSFNIVVIATSGNLEYDVWINPKNTYCMPSYVYACDSPNVIITHIGNVTQTSAPSGTACNIDGKVAGSTAVNAINARNLNGVINTNPGSTTYYFPIFSVGKTDGVEYSPRGSDTLQFGIGNTWAELMLGASGGKQGWILLYGNATQYHVELTTPDTLTANRRIYFPNMGGEMLVRGNNYDTLWTGTLTGTNSTTITNGWSGGWSYYCIVGKPGSDGAFSTIMVPKGAITTSDTLWQLGSGSTYASFRLKYSGNNLIVTKVQSGSITGVYGMR